MSRRPSVIGSLIEGFNTGYDITGRVLRDRGMRGVAEAKVQETPGEFPEQDPAVVQEKVAEQMAADSGGAEAVKIARASGGPRQAPTFSLLGQTQNTPFTPEQESKARQLAQVGVLEKMGDVDGAQRMRSNMKQGELADLQIADTKARGTREAKRFDWEEQQRAADEAYKSGMGDVFAGSSFGRKQGAFAQAQEAYQTQKAKYDADIAAGKTDAVAPMAPQRPTYTASELLLDGAQALAYKAKHGKASPEELQMFAEKMRAVDDEGYLRALRMAQEGAPLTAVVEAFNAQGKAKIDPATITEDKTVTRDGGVKSRLITFKTPEGVTQTIDTYAGLAELGKAGDAFNQALQLQANSRAQAGEKRADAQLVLAQRADGRAGAAAGRAAAEFAAGSNTRALQQETAGLQLQLAREQDPAKRQEISARLEQMRGAASAGGAGGGGGSEPADVKVARALVAAGSAPDMRTALEMTVNNPSKAHQAFVEANLRNFMPGDKAVAAADQVMTSMGYGKSGGRWVMGGSGAPGGAVGPAPGTVVNGYRFKGGNPNDQKNWESLSQQAAPDTGRGHEGSTKGGRERLPTEAEAHAQARAAVDRGVGLAQVNELLQGLGHKPLPAARGSAAQLAALGGSKAPAAGQTSPSRSAELAAGLGASNDASAQGEKLDAAMAAKEAAYDRLMSYGSRQKAQDPEGFKAAREAFDRANADARLLRQQYERAAGSSARPAFVGAQP